MLAVHDNATLSMNLNMVVGSNGQDSTLVCCMRLQSTASRSVCHGAGFHAHEVDAHEVYAHEEPATCVCVKQHLCKNCQNDSR